jgi:hypothetical protein
LSLIVAVKSAPDITMTAACSKRNSDAGKCISMIGSFSSFPASKLAFIDENESITPVGLIPNRL